MITTPDEPHPQQTEEERREQRINWAAGELCIRHPEMTGAEARRLVKLAVEQLQRCGE